MKRKKKSVAKIMFIRIFRAGTEALIEARHVRRFRYKGFRLFAHQYSDVEDFAKWRVSEFTTGHCIPRASAMTRAEAIGRAKLEIDRVGISAAAEAIDRVSKEHGIANK